MPVCLFSVNKVQQHQKRLSPGYDIGRLRPIFNMTTLLS